MTTTTAPIHHPSCPVRAHRHTVTCPTKIVESSDGTWDTIRTVVLDCDPACICEAPAWADDGHPTGLPMGRTPDMMLLDIVGHADTARLAFITRPR